MNVRARPGSGKVGFDLNATDRVGPTSWRRLGGGRRIMVRDSGQTGMLSTATKLFPLTHTCMLIVPGYDVTLVYDI